MGMVTLDLISFWDHQRQEDILTGFGQSIGWTGPSRLVDIVSHAASLTFCLLVSQHFLSTKYYLDRTSQFVARVAAERRLG